MSVGIAEVVDAGDVIPAALDQVMGDRGADDAAQAGDDDVCFFGKLRMDDPRGTMPVRPGRGPPS